MSGPLSRRLSALLVAAATSVSLAACGSDGDSGSSPEPSTPASSSAESSTATEQPTTDAATSSSSAPTAAAAPVAVNKTITDPELGNKFQILRYIDGYPASAAAKSKYSTVADGKVVLVEVRATAGTKYSGNVGSGDFRLTKTPNDIDVTSTTILDSEVTAAGYKPIEDADGGETTTGWLVFVVDKDLTKLVLRVKRLAYKVIGGGNIAEKTWDLTLN